MRARCVHIGFNFEGKSASTAELEKLFSTALDWLRYDSRCWIIYTTTELDVWRDRIHKVIVGPKALPPPPGTTKPKEPTFLLFEIDEKTHEGYAPLWVWEWLSKDRSKQFR